MLWQKILANSSHFNPLLIPITLDMGTQVYSKLLFILLPILLIKVATFSSTWNSLDGHLATNPTHSMLLTGVASAYSPLCMCTSVWFILKALVWMRTWHGNEDGDIFFDKTIETTKVIQYDDCFHLIEFEQNLFLEIVFVFDTLYFDILTMVATTS